MEKHDKKIEKSNQSEIITVKLYTEDDIFEDEGFQGISTGICSVLGTRKSQQDSVFAEFNGERGIAIVCDGMGGLQGGEIASQTAVQILANDFFLEGEILDIQEFLCQEAYKTDQEVGNLCDENGMSLECGTTLVSIIIDKGRLYWLSVGDSKIYFIRDHEIICLNRLHNYRMTMDDMLSQGQISMEEYCEKETQAEALISFVGMRNLSLMDVGPKGGLELKDNDIILLTSDGLYRLLTDNDIIEIVKRNMFDMQKAAKALINEAAMRVTGSQDNTSVAIIRYQAEIK